MEVDAWSELVAAVNLEVDASYELVAAVDLQVGARYELVVVVGTTACKVHGFESRKVFFLFRAFF